MSYTPRSGDNSTSQASMPARRSHVRAALGRTQYGCAGGRKGNLRWESGGEGRVLYTGEINGDKDPHFYELFKAIALSLSNPQDPTATAEVVALIAELLPSSWLVPRRIKLEGGIIAAGVGIQCRDTLTESAVLYGRVKKEKEYISYQRLYLKGVGPGFASVIPSALVIVSFLLNYIWRNVSKRETRVMKAHRRLIPGRRNITEIKFNVWPQNSCHEGVVIFVQLPVCRSGIWVVNHRTQIGTRISQLRNKPPSGRAPRRCTGYHRY
ncbi:hypothetical protein V8E53_001768 [Lactarius tabidus]